MATKDSISLRRATTVIQSGGVIAYPTETVWGFGCDPDNQRAVEQLLALKQRPVEKGLILVAASAEQFAPYLQGLDDALVSKFAQLTSKPASKPTTWLVPHNGRAKDWIRGDFQSVALRVSTSALVIELCNSLGGPVVSTSANISGEPTCESPAQLQRFLNGVGLDFILPGRLKPNAKPSEIRDLISGKVIRGT